MGVCGCLSVGHLDGGQGFADGLGGACLGLLGGGVGAGGQFRRALDVCIYI